MLEQKRDGQPDLNLGENEDLARLKLFLSTPHDERKSLLKDDVLQRVAKCDSCSGYVSRREILTDGHTCENCGTVMYEALPKGSQVRFSYFFNPEGDIKVVTFVEGGDAKEGTLVPSLLSGGS